METLDECGEPVTPICDEKHTLTVVRTNTDDSEKPQLHPGITIVNATTAKTENEKPTAHRDEMVNQVPLHKIIIPTEVSHTNINNPMNKRKAHSIKLTKSGTIYFLKNLEDAIQRHPILSKDAEIIKELLNEAIANATEALREQQKEATKMAEKHHDVEISTKPTRRMNSIITKEKLPLVEKVVKVPHKLNETKVVVCHDQAKNIKVNTSIIVKHDDGVKHVNLLNNTITVKHDNPTKPTQLHVAEYKPEKRVFEENVNYNRNARHDVKKSECHREPKITNTVEHNIKKQEVVSTEPKIATTLHLIEVQSDHKKTGETDYAKTKNKLTSLLEKKLTAEPTPKVSELNLDKDIELPLFEDEVDSDVKSPDTIDIEDQVYEETYANGQKGAKQDSKTYLNCKPSNIWYPDYYQTYFCQNPCPNYSSYSNMGTYDLGTETKYNAYKNNWNTNTRQKNHNEILRKCWWNRKVHFRTNRDVNQSKKEKCGKNFINSIRNLHYKQFKN